MVQPGGSATDYYMTYLLRQQSTVGAIEDSHNVGKKMNFIKSDGVRKDGTVNGGLQLQSPN